MELKGTKTLENLYKAFKSESESRNKYTYYEKQARSEGYEQIGDVFKDTAKNELAHAFIWYKFLNGEHSTVDNLKDGVNEENQKWTEMYKQFESDALDEGFEDIARLFHQIANIERHHELRFQNLLTDLLNNEFFENASEWRCKTCGYLHNHKKAPSECPVCKSDKGYFKKSTS